MNNSHISIGHHFVSYILMHLGTSVIISIVSAQYCHDSQCCHIQDNVRWGADGHRADLATDLSPEHPRPHGLSYTAASKPPTPTPRPSQCPDLHNILLSLSASKSDHCSKKRDLLFSNGLHKGFSARNTPMKVAS